MSTDVSITDLIAEANARFTKTPECYSDQHIEVRLTRALQAVTVPTENEREALIAAIDPLKEIEMDEGDDATNLIADAVLAVGFSRTVPIDTELGALLARWDVTERPDGWNSGDEHHLADLLITALRSASQPVQVEVTDEMVERAGRVMYVVWDEWAEEDIQAEGIHALVRSALEAALGGDDS